MPMSPRRPAAAGDPELLVNDSAGRVYAYRDGAMVELADFPVALTDIAVAPDGTLYGIDFFDLYRLDPDAGTATRLGAHGVSSANAFDIAADGTAVLAGNGGPEIYALDLATAAATPLLTGFDAAEGDLLLTEDRLYVSTDDLWIDGYSRGDFVLQAAYEHGTPDIFGLAPAGALGEAPGDLLAFAGDDAYRVDFGAQSFEFVADLFPGTGVTIFGAAFGALDGGDRAPALSAVGRWTAGLVEGTGERVGLSDPALGTVSTDNADIGGTARVEWGTPISGSTASSFAFDGAGSDGPPLLDLDARPFFSLGTFDYVNGRNASASDAFGGGVLGLAVDLGGEEEVAAEFVFEVVSTENTTGDPVLDGDFVTLVEGTEIAEGRLADGTAVGLEIVGFSRDGGTSFTEDFSSPEDGGASATLFARLVDIGGGLNTAPLAADDTAEAEAGRLLLLDVLANDTDADGDPLLVTVASTTDNATVSVLEDGTIRYVAAPDFSGTDSFAYTVSDGRGGTDTATVTVEVAPFRPVIFLDFDTPLEVDISPVVDDDGEVTYAVDPSGREAPAAISGADRARILEGVQRIFDDSGLGRFRVSDERPSVGDYHAVRFAPKEAAEDPTGEIETGRLYGIAYEGVDRFDKAKNSTVAVFVDPADPILPGDVDLSEDSDDFISVVEVVAHEVGHAFGLRHINPVRGDGSEVMDYAPGPAPVFYADEAGASEPPIDGEPRSPIVTHNPAFHLRRWVLGETEDALLGDGLDGGSWDFESGAAYVRYQFRLLFESLTAPIEALFIERDDGAFGIGPNGEDLETTLDLVAEGVGPGDEIVFEAVAGETVRLVAATAEGGRVDAEIVFDAEGGATTAIPAEELGSQPASIMAMGGGEIGSGAVEQTAAQTVSAEANAPIVGTVGDDRLSGGFGDDIIEGGAGADTMVYDLARADVQEARGPGGSVSVRLPSGEVDRLFSIETVELEDGRYLYDLAGEDLPFVYRLYSAALARTPDEAGLRFWSGARDGGLSERALAEAFVAAPEFGTLFGVDPSDREFVGALYENVLLRDPDPAGESFWLDALATGAYDRASMLLFFSDGPENTDRNADNYDEGVWVL